MTEEQRRAWKPSRKGSGVIWNSTYTMQDLVGVWNTSVTADGSMSNEMLVMLPDGTGAFAEANMGPYRETPITWYVEGDMLTISTKDHKICDNPINYVRNVVVLCMTGEEKRFNGLLGAAYGLDFYRDIAPTTLTERETEAKEAMAFLHNDCED